VFQVQQRRTYCKRLQKKQSIKKWKIQEELDEEDDKKNKKKQGFGEDLK